MAPVIFLPATVTVPAVAVSSAPTRLSRVVFPLPDGPSTTARLARIDLEVQPVERDDLDPSQVIATEYAPNNTIVGASSRCPGCRGSYRACSKVAVVVEVSIEPPSSPRYPRNHAVGGAGRPSFAGTPAIG